VVVAAGIDVGGTKMLGVVVDTDQPEHVVREHRFPTPSEPDAIVDGIVDLVGELTPPDGARVGVGVPGLVDRADVFRFAPNLPSVLELPLGELLGERLGTEVVADNDATCAAMAEFSAGAGRGHRNGILLTIGTGIGAGLFLDGRIHHGAHGFAGEPGHMLVDPRGPQCPCGRRGCWERFASGSGLGRLGRDAAIAGSLGTAVQLAGGDREAVRGEHVVAAARAGDPDAGAVLDEFAWWMAAGIANLVDLLDPSVVVLGGGVMEAADVLLDRLAIAMPPQVVAHGHRPPVELVVAELGERAGAVGAALLAHEEPVPA
jgi:glucokinase